MTKKLKVLLVDDEAQILELIKLYLEMDGHTILLMTGFAKIDKKEAKDLGALDLMAKPIDFGLLDNHLMKIASDLP